jgi:hypothetical protein
MERDDGWQPDPKMVPELNLRRVCGINGYIQNVRKVREVESGISLLKNQ